MIDSPALRIAEINVKGLFGIYDHSVKLFLKDRITIVHGQNGVGKTALLRLVEAFVNGNYFKLTKIPFDSFCLKLTDNSKIGFRRIKKDRGAEGAQDSSTQGEFYYVDPNNSEKTTSSEKGMDIEDISKILDREISWIRRVGPNQWHDLRRDELISTEQFVATYEDAIHPRYRKRFFKMPEWFDEIRKQLKVHLIETQRLLEFSDEKDEPLYSKPKERVTTMVQKYSTELRQKIGDTLTEYAKSSQILDQSFPQRLLSSNPASNGTLTIDQLKERMTALDEKRARLKRIGLVDEDMGYPFDASKLDSLEKTEKAVMTLYVDDTAKKLGVLDTLANRLTLLLDNVNKKFRNKSISIDKKLGLVAINKGGHPLELEALSSGEQHELVLIYDLLFRVSPDTLVLIDEPELSLHVTWQKVFVDDLLAVVKTVGFDVLLATHSPFIAGDRHDLMISLPPDSE